MNKVDELIKKLNEYKEILKKDDIDEKIKAKIKAEMDKRKFSEADATRHIVDRDRGEKPQPPKPEKLLQTEQIVYKSNGQWQLDKSNEIKPVIDGEKVNTYDRAANINRKATRTGEERPEMGRNQGVRQYTTSGSSMSQAHEAAQQKVQQKKSKASLRTFKDMSPEEQAEMKAKYEKPLAKGIDTAKEALMTGNLPVMGSTPSQPTDEQMFGHLVKSEKEIAAAQDGYENRMQKTVEALQKPVDHLNKSAVEVEWSYGKSFNSLLKEKLSEKELAERNSHIGE